MFSLLLFGMDEKIFGKLRTMGRTNKGRPYVSFHRNCALGGGVHECFYRNIPNLHWMGRDYDVYCCEADCFKAPDYTLTPNMLFRA